MSDRTPAQPTGLQKAIDDLLSEMTNFSGDDKEYAAMVKQLSKLYKLKTIDHEIKSGKRVSPDTWVIAGANILGVLLIVSYEQKNVITSKALALWSKLR